MPTASITKKSDRAYDAANYGKYIYDEVPEPRLAPEDAEWAKQFVPR